MSLKSTDQFLPDRQSTCQRPTLSNLSAVRKRIVFATLGGGFGDCWGAASTLLRLSEQSGHETLLYNPDARIIAIISHLESWGAVQAVDRFPDILIHSSPNPNLLAQAFPDRRPATIVPWGYVFRRRFLPVRGSLWQPNDSRHVVVQLTPRRTNGPKAFPPGDADKLIAGLLARGYSVSELGLPLSISECISRAAASAFFVGVCSGMSHLCHSVGTPVNLILNSQKIGQLRECHQGNKYIVFSNSDEFLGSLEPLK